MLRLKKPHTPRAYGKLCCSDNELSEEAGQAQPGPEWLSKEGVLCFGVYWSRGWGCLRGLNFLNMGFLIGLLRCRAKGCGGGAYLKVFSSQRAKAESDSMIIWAWFT